MNLKKILYNFYLWPAFGTITLFCLLAMPFFLLGAILVTRWPLGKAVRKAIRLYGWLLVRLLSFPGPVAFENQAPEISSPAIFTPNHYSSVDPYLFGLLPVENAFVTSWPFKIPVYNHFMRLAGYINSRQGWTQLVRQGRQLLEAGCSLIIWPEGHRSRDGSLGRFRMGAFRLACLTGTPIIPVCIVGTDRVLPPGQRFLSPHRVKMILLPPISPERYRDHPEGAKRLREETREAIAAELRRQGVEPAKTAVPADHLHEVFFHPHLQGSEHGTSI